MGEVYNSNIFLCSRLSTIEKTIFHGHINHELTSTGTEKQNTLVVSFSLRISFTYLYVSMFLNRRNPSLEIQTLIHKYNEEI